MLRHCTLARMRLLCLTMLPDGGALTPALKTLGYKPYSLRSSFQQGHASTHPVEWSQMLDRRKTLNKALFGEYDCFVGPPAALLYDVILRDCPSYTKVVLVEEPDKARWAADYEAYLDSVRKALRHASKNKITVSFTNMLEKMVVRGADEVTPGNTSTAASADARGPSSVSKFSYAKPATTTRTSSALDLERALKAEAAKARQQLAQPGEEAAAAEGAGASASSEEAQDVEEAEDGGPSGDAAELPMSPRAIALERYEESVKLSIPSSRLLVYRYGDGWEPLCEFLERPVPQEPFPPYDNGLHVLGYLQERVYWAQAVMYVLVVITAALVLVNTWPYLGSLQRIVGEIYQDYQLAFGKDEDSAPRRPRAPAENFEDEWKKRGGVVVVEPRKAA